MLTSFNIEVWFYLQNRYKLCNGLFQLVRLFLQLPHVMRGIHVLATAPFAVLFRVGRQPSILLRSCFLLQKQRRNGFFSFCSKNTRFAEIMCTLMYTLIVHVSIAKLLLISSPFRHSALVQLHRGEPSNRSLRL